MSVCLSVCLSTREVLRPEKPITLNPSCAAAAAATAAADNEGDDVKCPWMASWCDVTWRVHDGLETEAAGCCAGIITYR